MEVKTCRNCRRLFNYLGSGPRICPACRDSLEKRFYKVKEYIRDHPHEGIQSVSEAMDVSANQLRQWVKEERLQFSADSGVALTCENCGATIYTGRFCNKCKSKMADGLAKAFSGEASDESSHHGGGMRFIKH